jgi:intracellular multiplication protein IcmV
MKKRKTSRIVGLFKSIFNVRSWLDYDRIKAFTLYLWNGIKKMVIPQKVEVTEQDASQSFRTMVASMNLSEQDLASRAKGLYRLSLLMCFVSLLIFGYAIYQIVSGHWKATIVSLVVTLIGLVLAFRYHFWYFQIKERKLGCTFQEWYKRGLLGGKL